MKLAICVTIQEWWVHYSPDPDHKDVEIMRTVGERSPAEPEKALAGLSTACYTVSSPPLHPDFPPPGFYGCRRCDRPGCFNSREKMQPGLLYRRIDGVKRGQEDEGAVEGRAAGGAEARAWSGERG